MTIYDHHFCETFRSPKKFNLIIRALYAGWAGDSFLSDFVAKHIVLSKHDQQNNHTVYLFLNNLLTFDIKQKKGTDLTIGTLAQVHYRTLRFDPNNPLRIVGITYKNTPLYWDFDLKNFFAGLIPSTIDKRRHLWLKKIYRALIAFWSLHHRPPSAQEFVAFIRSYLNYHNLKEIYSLLHLGLGKFWLVRLENHKVNPKARRCY